MRLIITDFSDQETLLDVAPNTSARRCLKDGYWFFRPLSGGQLVLAADDVKKVEIGNVTTIGE